MISRAMQSLWPLPKVWMTSPRAGINLAIAARAHALLQGRAYVTPADVKAIGLDVMRHRIIASYEAQAEGVSPEQIVQRIFDHVPVP